MLPHALWKVGDHSQTRGCDNQREFNANCAIRHEVCKLFQNKKNILVDKLIKKYRGNGEMIDNMLKTKRSSSLERQELIIIKIKKCKKYITVFCNCTRKITPFTVNIFIY